MSLSRAAFWTLIIGLLAGWPGPVLLCALIVWLACD